MSTITRNMRHGTVIIADGSATPKTLIIPISSGDFAYTVKKMAQVIMNRGKIDHRSKGDETPMTVDFSILFSQWSHQQANTGMSPVDALLGTSVARVDNGWVSSDGCGDAWSVSVIFQIQDPCDPTHYEQLTFPDFHAEEYSFKENNTADQLSIKGNSLAEEPTRIWV